MLNQPATLPSSTMLPKPSIPATDTAAASSSPNTLSPTQKLNSLRQLMTQHEIDCYIVFSEDAHNSESITPHDGRREFISNFTGSAGTAVISNDSALLWTDSRYFIQAENQLDPTCWTLMKAGLEGVPTISNWLSSAAGISKIGIDPWTTSVSVYKRFKEVLGSKAEIVPIELNLVDVVWGVDQPAMPTSEVYTHSVEYAGVSAKDKIASIRGKMKSASTDYLLLSQLDEVAWLLNLRASDILYSPVFLSYLLMSAEKISLYANSARFNADANEALRSIDVEIRPYDAIKDDLKKLYSGDGPFKKIHLDPNINFMIYNAISDAQTNAVLKVTPVCVAKAKKNDIEIQGMKEAHVKDGMAEVKFLHWLSCIKEDESLFTMDECDLADKIDALRAEQDDAVSISFPTISAAGPNAALPHYYPQKKSCRTIGPEMYLLDSGGHYAQGTTDVTRTTHFGIPTPHEKLCWTLVLKGHIRLARAVFPHGTRGPQLDVLARFDLWNRGLEFLHSTGHGVGAFLNVHEGPCGITPWLQGEAGETVLTAGMILSNEPGYYGETFGIRHENLVAVVKKDDVEFPNEDVKFNAFETITLIPFDTTLIEFSVMSEEEIEWLNEYHKKVYEILSERFRQEEINKKIDNNAVIQWLKMATRPISADMPSTLSICR